MSTELTTTGKDLTLAVAGQLANEIAARHVFADYRDRKAVNTVARQDAGLRLFARYLAKMSFKVGELAHDPDAWQDITWGLVEGYARWLLSEGYSIGSINVRLSTVKTYAKLAHKAGALGDTERALIQTVAGYSRPEGKNVDETREDAGLATRRGHKKAVAVSLAKDQADALKTHRDEPQGRRDALLMGLLLDLGLRVGEVASLTIANVNLKDGTLTFYREKVHKTQTLELINGLLAVTRTYLEQDALAVGPLLRASQKGGRLIGGGMSRRAIAGRVKTLGERVGVEGLSPHDCRHYWATRAARCGTPIDRLQDAGGWASPAMPLHYVEAAKIANEGVRL